METTQKIDVLFEKSGAEGMRAYVFKSDVTGKFHAVLRDDECEETVGAVWCPTFEMAKSKAEAWVK